MLNLICMYYVVGTLMLCCTLMRSDLLAVLKPIPMTLDVKPLSPAVQNEQHQSHANCQMPALFHARWKRPNQNPQRNAHISAMQQCPPSRALSGSSSCEGKSCRFVSMPMPYHVVRIDLAQRTSNPLIVQLSLRLSRTAGLPNTNVALGKNQNQFMLCSRASAAIRFADGQGLFCFPKSNQS